MEYRSHLNLNVSPLSIYQEVHIFSYFSHDSLPFPALSRNIYSDSLPTYTMAWALVLIHHCSVRRPFHFSSGDLGGLNPLSWRAHSVDFGCGNSLTDWHCRHTTLSDSTRIRGEDQGAGFAWGFTVRLKNSFGVLGTSCVGLMELRWGHMPGRALWLMRPNGICKIWLCKERTEFIG